MDKLSAHDLTEEVVFMKGAQIGATELGFNFLGYIIDISPAPVLSVMPTVDMAKKNSKMRFDPMVEATPRLQEKIGTKRSRDAGNTMLQKDFAGGTVILAGANSAAGLRSMPARFLILDEIDAYPADLDNEGSPIELALARTKTFTGRRKIFKISTPTVQGQSAIEREFNTTDQRYFMVPCPHCGTYDHLVWEQLKWEDDDPETAAYECPHCEELIEERHKPTMFAKGHWEATAEENANPRRVGYHLNSLYSPLGWQSWAGLVREWQKAQKDINALKTFVNTNLGETWKDKGEAPPWEMLYERTKPYPRNKPPKEVVFLTAGVDVQRDRLEVEIVGWCKNKVSYSIDYRIFAGDTSLPNVWQELDSLIDETFLRSDGIQMRVRTVAIDSGYNTQLVYDYVRKKARPLGVIAIKGQETQRTIIGSPSKVDVAPNGKRVGTTQLWNVGVSVVKQELYGWLRQHLMEDGTVPNGYCHFPEYDAEHFKRLTAEQLQYKEVRGFKRPEWVNHYGRNEQLDCRVYARAAASLCGMDRFTEDDWGKMERLNLGTSAPTKKKKPRSSIW